jgi:POT family proton-dependent oligopeptide transporter
VASTGQPVSLAWALAFHILNDVGFSNVLPVALALYTRAAPKGLEGLMIAVYYLQLFLGNMLVGYVGSLYATMSATSFWLLHVAIMLLAGAMLLIARRFAGAVMAPPLKEPRAASA